MDIQVLQITNLIITAMMCGIITITQVVTYPLFIKVVPNYFVSFHQAYIKKVSIVIIPIMLMEIFVAIMLLIMDFYNDMLWYSILILSIVLIWLSTFFIQVPIHNSLAKKYDETRIRQLVYSNYVRTFLWYMKLVNAIVIL